MVSIFFPKLFHPPAPLASGRFPWFNTKEPHFKQFLIFVHRPLPREPGAGDGNAFFSLFIMPPPTMSIFFFGGIFSYRHRRNLLRVRVGLVVVAVLERGTHNVTIIIIIMINTTPGSSEQRTFRFLRPERSPGIVKITDFTIMGALKITKRTHLPPVASVRWENWWGVSENDNETRVNEGASHIASARKPISEKWRIVFPAANRPQKKTEEKKIKTKDADTDFLSSRS